MRVIVYTLLGYEDVWAIVYCG